MRSMGNKQEGGFTLIELSIVLVIIALILGGVFAGQSLISAGRLHDAMSISSDLSETSREFKRRYHYLPGDFPIDTAIPEIPDISAACRIGGANAGNGDGIVSALESVCVPEHLAHAGYIKAALNPQTGFLSLNTYYGAVRIVANSLSNIATGANPMPLNVINVVEYANIPCEAALEFDLKVDDGNLATGNARASVSACSPSQTNDPVPFFAVPL